MRTNRVGTRTRGAARRKLVWDTVDGTVAGLAAATTTSVQLNPSLLANLPGFTLTRVHLRISIPYVAVTDATRIGIIVGRTSDIGTVRPDPNTENELDWMYLTNYFATASGAAVDTQREIVIDVRSRRKMDEVGMTPLLVIRNGNAAAATYRFHGRVLFALP